MGQECCQKLWGQEGEVVVQQQQRSPVKPPIMEQDKPAELKRQLQKHQQLSAVKKGLTNQQAGLNNKKIQLGQRKQTYQLQYKRSEANLQQIRRQIEDLKNQVSLKNDELAKANFALKTASQFNNQPLTNLPESPNKLIKQKKDLEQQMKNLNYSISIVQAQLNQVSNKTRENEQKIRELTHKIQQIQKQGEKYRFDIVQIRQQINNLKSSTQQTSSDVKQIQSRKQANLTEMQKIKMQTEECNRLTKELSFKAPQKTYQDNSQNRYLQLFAGNILQGEDDYKQYLTEVLERRIKNKIIGTKLLYRYDALNKVNFHKYLDNKNHIVVIVRLKNGYTLGAWSEGSFQPRMTSNKDALIFSLTNRKAFEPLELNKRAIAYDDFFLIFGNSQLRLKSQERKVFSNFAISNGYYHTRGQKVDILLGSGTQREVQMEQLQVFQLNLK